MLKGFYKTVYIEMFKSVGQGVTIMVRENLPIEQAFKSFESEVASRVEEIVKNTVLPQIKEIADIERELFQFEIAFSALMPENELIKTAKDVRAVRDENWSKALSKSSGDFIKAAAIFSSCEDV